MLLFSVYVNTKWIPQRILTNPKLTITTKAEHLLNICRAINTKQKGETKCQIIVVII